MTIYFLKTKGPYPINKIFQKNGRPSYGHIFTWFLYLWKSLTFLFKDGQFLFLLFYLMIGIMGTAMSPFLYPLQLLDLINRFETLKNVIRSVTKNST